MGWYKDYTFDYLAEKNKNKGGRNAYDKILHFIRINKNATVEDIRNFIIKEKNNDKY